MHNWPPAVSGIPTTGEGLWMDLGSRKLSTIDPSYPQVLHMLFHTLDSGGYLVIQPLIHRLHRTYCCYRFFTREIYRRKRVWGEPLDLSSASEPAIESLGITSFTGSTIAGTVGL